MKEGVGRWVGGLPTGAVVPTGHLLDAAVGGSHRLVESREVLVSSFAVSQLASHSGWVGGWVGGLRRGKCPFSSFSVPQLASHSVERGWVGGWVGWVLDYMGGWVGGWVDLPSTKGIHIVVI